MPRDGLYLGQDGDGGELVLDERALTTHAFVVGMTGSGKTGLCAVLIEELLEEGVPVIAVDSKGDLANVLLALDPAEPRAFEPWMDVDVARREGKTVAQAAEAAARTLGDGLRDSHLTREDLLAWRELFEPRLYTPGSTAGIPLDVVGTLAPPAGADEDDRAEAADAAARTLLGLLRIEADPVQSREYLLLHQLLLTLWSEGRAVTLKELVRLVIEPPIAEVGAMPLEAFYPRKERSGLAMALNGLLASPRFAAWRGGEPFHIPSLLRAPDGRPRLSIYSVAHLPDEERVFAVALLLERLNAWTRQQPGTSELRAVVLLDEIFGYFPPHPVNPPTKKPLLLLLKQARAFGLGVVLATQNPVDLDYRGLANIGTWLVGRLQTEGDKGRIRGALLGAAAAADLPPAELDRLLSSVERRVFLLHSIHRPRPVLLRSRTAFSFLRGPLSEEEIGRLAKGMRPAALVPAPAGAAAIAPVLSPAPPATVTRAAEPPALALDPELGPIYEQQDEGPAKPYLLVRFGLRYRFGTSVTEEQVHTLGFPLEGVLAAGEVLEGAPYALTGTPLGEVPPPGMTLASLPRWLTEARAARLSTVIRERLLAKLDCKLWFDPQTRMLSQPTETPEAFAARVLAAQGSARDTVALARKVERLKLELAQAQREVEGRRLEKWTTVGAAGMGLLFGRRSSMFGVTSTVGSVLSRRRSEESAEGRVQHLQLEISQAEQDLAQASRVDPARFEEQRVIPRPSDVSLLRVAVVFLVP